MHLCDHSALEIRNLIISKQASAVEVLESCLQRIERIDGRPGKIENATETTSHSLKTLPARKLKK
jgi:aspartyl-tRNA(Asn)/glutamyl-tRNA(Gln) amidotransferase subunit A